jgi:glycosyltransferase involved in cell wall biosynthesis
MIVEPPIMMNRTDDATPPMRQAGELPSVSAILLAYNCERFVAEAVDSALNQDYRGPLEIVLSDDASTDRTFAVLQERAARYKGAHRVEIRRRRQNAGSKSAHLNDVFSACMGEILVSFDGDDVAETSRVRKIVEKFLGHRQAKAVYSSYSLVDQLGRLRGRGDVPHPPDGLDAAAWFARVDAYASGATLAVHRSVVDTFGSLDPKINEDVVLPFRASLLGRVGFVAEPLVKVRRHPESFTADWQRFASLEHYRERMQLGIERAEWAMRSRLADLRTAAALMPDQRDRWERLRGIVEASFREAEMTRALTSGSFTVRIRALFELLRAGAYLDELPQHACLALTPGLYLRYKRYRLGAHPPEPAAH